MAKGKCRLPASSLGDSHAVRTVTLTLSVLVLGWCECCKRVPMLFT